MRTHHPRSGTKGVKKRYNALEKGDRPCKKGTKGVKRYNGSQHPREVGHTIKEGVQRESRSYKGSQDPREGGHAVQARESSRGTTSQTFAKADTRRGTRPSGRRTHHPRRGTKGVKKRVQRESRPSRPSKKGYKGSQDPREGGHTIQHQGGHLR